MRSAKLAPVRESCEKKWRLAIARECRRAAADSLRLSRSGASRCLARSALRTHRVARTSTRFVALSADAFAEVQARAADAVGAATRRSISAPTSVTGGLGIRIHLVRRYPAREL